MAEKESTKAVCFCGQEIPADFDWGTICTCSNCGALCVAEDADDLNDFFFEMAEMLDLPTEKIEKKVIREYDEDIYGNKICLLIARPKPAEADK